MSWKKVGGWLKENAGGGAALVGSLLTGNVPGAIAAGASLVQSATGGTSATEVLERLQNDPQTVVRLKELALEAEADIRRHLETMTRLELEDAQHEHLTTQETIRAGDRTEDRFVRWTRPGLAWAGLAGASIYAMNSPVPDPVIFTGFMAAPYGYLGLREVGKGIRSVADMKVMTAIRGAKK